MEGDMMIITDDDRRYVLTAYRRERQFKTDSPAGVIAALRNVWANLVAEDVSKGNYPTPEFARRWAVAEDYYRSMRDRPDYWFRRPR